VYTPKSYEPSNRSPAKRLGVLIAGWFFIVLGILGLFLPILQGILFLVIGAYLLSSESPWMHERIQRMFVRFPRVGLLYDQTNEASSNLKDRILNRFS
jgi:uncharacterized protein